MMLGAQLHPSQRLLLRWITYCVQIDNIWSWLMNLVRLCDIVPSPAESLHL